MFDVCTRITYSTVPKWYKDLTRVCTDEIPICLVGNKVDMRQDRRVTARQITFHRKRSVQYYDLSGKTHYQLQKPFVWLLRKLVKDPELKLVKAPLVPPIEVAIHEDQLAQLAQETQEAAASASLPDDE